MPVIEKWHFEEPYTAAVRVPINTNADGEIAGEGDSWAGQKSFTFSHTARDASYDQIAFGGSGANGGDPGDTAGILMTFIEYLLGGSYIASGVTRTIIQPTAEGEPTPTPPEP